MSRYKIEGGHKLHGNINVHGAKNAALPILAATVINQGKSVIHNCPDLSDIKSTIEILEILGCKVSLKNNVLTVDSSSLSICDIPSCIMSKTRSSTIFAGALAARCKKGYIAASGGCQIGSRPIDIHLEAFKTMGMEISETKDVVVCKANKIKAGMVYLKFPSVGATENVMLASSLTSAKTTILNAAMEPEIVNLAQYLRSIGVKISGDGTDKITVIGTNNPTDGEVTVIPDRIVASTYMISALITKGKITVNNVCPPHFSPVVAVLRKMGAHVETFQNRVCIEYLQDLKNIPYLATGPYPGFPTDAQPLMVSLMCLSRGLAIVKESIFENRLGHCLSLNSMGGNIEIKGRYAFINGVERLNSASVYASDLRCGAALCLASLAAEGISYVSGTEFVDRGYENICRDLKSLGASIERIE